jgi:predicted RNA-binding Zn-ribbon protein involved in translation (DUF1610 family)
MSELNRECPVCGQGPLIRLETKVQITVTSEAAAQRAEDFVVFYCRANGHAVLLRERDLRQNSPKPQKS